MMSFASTESLISLTLLLFAYIFSITFSGTVQAYVARWYGDDTADDLGFTEFNPFLFINVFDFIWFLAFKIMIGRPVPFRLTAGLNRAHTWWRLRTFFLFASRPLCNLFITIIASIISILVCKSVFIDLFATASAHQSVSMTHLLCLFCGSLVWANIFLATFESCRQVIHFFVLHKLEKDYRFIEYADYLLVLGPIMLWLFFSRTIAHAFIYLVDCVVLGVSKVCGIV